MKYFFKQVPEEMCMHCLPDCSYTIYETSVASAPFRKCDLSSYGVSQFCSANAPQPTIYADQVLEKLKKSPKLCKFLVKKRLKKFPSMF